MGTVSWDHFFTSLNQYYIGLRQSVPHGGIVFPHHGVPMSGQRTITPQEVEGLKAVLQLIAAVVCQVGICISAVSYILIKTIIIIIIIIIINDSIYPAVSKASRTGNKVSCQPNDCPNR